MGEKWTSPSRHNLASVLAYLARIVLYLTLPDALWWAVTTVTTVGYGDRYPTTTTGRLIAVGLMVVGIALPGVVTATIAAWFLGRIHQVQQAEERTEATMADVLTELREVKARLDSIERQGARRPQPLTL